MTWVQLQEQMTNNGPGNPPPSEALAAWAPGEARMERLVANAQVRESEIAELRRLLSETTKKGELVVTKVVEELLANAQYTQSLNGAASAAVAQQKAGLELVVKEADQKFKEIQASLVATAGKGEETFTAAKTAYEHQQGQLQKLEEQCRAAYEAQKVYLEALGDETRLEFAKLKSLSRGGGTGRGDTEEDPRDGAAGAWSQTGATASATSVPRMPQAFELGSPMPPAAASYPEAASTREKEYSVFNRDWGDHKKPDLAGDPAGYSTWQERAMDHLAKDKPEIRQWLLWSTQEFNDQRGTVELTPSAAAEAGNRCGVANVKQANYVLYTAIKHIISDHLLSRAKGCEGEGLVLWRKLFAEAKGTAPQVLHAKCRDYTDPARSSSVLQLWEDLPVWEQLGEELRRAGYILHEGFLETAFEKLIPSELSAQMVGNPELVDYSSKLRWVRARMTYARGEAQAAVRQKGPTAKYKDTDVDMNHVDVDEAYLNHLQEECRNSMLAGDEYNYSYYSNMLFQLAKTKGKGKGKGWPKGGKGEGKKGAGGKDWWRKEGETRRDRAKITREEIREKGKAKGTIEEKEEKES